MKVYTTRKRSLSVERLQVVFKIVERCNINCSYCYYYNMGDSSALERPPVVNIETASKIAKWLEAGCRELNIQRLSISFHGGEPMMLKPELFDSICQIFRENINDDIQLSFNIQTNGTILSDKWLSILSRNRVHVGISIDGDRLAQDRYRLNRKGESTFEKINKNIKTIVQAARTNEILGPATISVLDYQNDYAKIYSYLRSLGIRRMSFLLPDRNYDTKFENSDENAQKYGECLFQIFNAWLNEDNRDIFIRFIHEFIDRFQFKDTNEITKLKEKIHAVDFDKEHRSTQIIIMHSDGNVGLSDSYIPALSWFKNTPECSIQKISLAEFLMNEVFDEIENARTSLNIICKECEWSNICKGGDLENRFSKSNGFDNPSVYCDGYLYFYRKAEALLISGGYPEAVIQNVKKGQLAVAL